MHEKRLLIVHYRNPMTARRGWQGYRLLTGNVLVFCLRKGAFARQSGGQRAPGLLGQVSGQLLLLLEVLLRGGQRGVARHQVPHLVELLHGLQHAVQEALVPVLTCTAHRCWHASLARYQQLPDSEQGCLLRATHVHASLSVLLEADADLLLLLLHIL
jgi:hypothetical protein